MTTPSVKTPSRAFTYYIENLVVLSSGPLGSAFPETQGLPPVFEVKNKSEEELNELCDRSDNLLCKVLDLSDANVPVLEPVLHLPLNLLPTDLAQYSRKRANSAQLGGLHAADPHVRKRTCYKEQLRLELKHGSQKGDDGERLREAIEWNVNYSGTDRVRVNGGPKVQKMWKQNLRQHLTDLATFGL